MQSLSGGWVNRIWLCCHDNDKMVVRIHPDVERMPGVDRKLEYDVMRVLADKQLIAAVYAKYYDLYFRNRKKQSLLLVFYMFVHSILLIQGGGAR